MAAISLRAIGRCGQQFPFTSGSRHWVHPIEAIAMLGRARAGTFKGLPIQISTV
ncbi:MAG: hypothetical protein O2890_10825 [Cyanobacteria bacterium]|nr:hypothetical protein [Cyanobacteriota bacterium]